MNRPIPLMQANLSSPSGDWRRRQRLTRELARIATGLEALASDALLCQAESRDAFRFECDPCAETGLVCPKHNSQPVENAVTEMKRLDAAFRSQLARFVEIVENINPPASPRVEAKTVEPETWSVVETDNFGGDYPIKSFVVRGVSIERAFIVCESLNSRLGPDSQRWTKVVRAGYELAAGFTPGFKP